MADISDVHTSDLKEISDALEALSCKWLQSSAKVCINTDIRKLKSLFVFFTNQKCVMGDGYIGG
jgi:hypothetical protein